MIAKLFEWFVVSAIDLLSKVLDIIFNIVGFISLPNFSEYSQYIYSFWDITFEFVGYIRSAFLIGSFEMNLIYTILFINLTYKPLISVVKMFIHWFNHLKL